MTSKNIRRATAEDVPVLTQVRNDAHAKTVAHLGAYGKWQVSSDTNTASKRSMPNSV
jgi:hypothetical protein